MENEQVRIFGAGMAGLLAAIMWRREEPVVYERQNELPDNHGALLRFRSDVVSRVTSIPFHEVDVQKAVWDGVNLRTEATLADGNAYALKVSEQVTPRSVLDLRPVTRYVAPDSFMNDLLRTGSGSILLGKSVEYEDVYINPGEEPIISTLPMPTLMDIAQYDGPRPNFGWREIWTLRARITDPYVRVYQTVYDVTSGPVYRSSLTGNLLTIEATRDCFHVSEEQRGKDDASAIAYDEEKLAQTYIRSVLRQMGIRGRVTAENIEVKYQKYGKLLPLSPEDDAKRRAFMFYMTDNFNIYSLGRFATWRQILLDDVVNDIEMIKRFIRDRSVLPEHRVPR